MTGLHVVAPLVDACPLWTAGFTVLAFVVALACGFAERNRLRARAAAAEAALAEEREKAAAQATAHKDEKDELEAKLTERLAVAEARAAGHLAAFNLLRAARLDELRAAITITYGQQNGPPS